jgi:helix-turn-helix protein
MRRLTASPRRCRLAGGSSNDGAPGYPRLQLAQLFELRRACQLSQEQLAATLAEKQPSISRLEQRTDMYVSTLRRYIEAMGGQLDIVARFPDGEASIDQFAEEPKDLPEQASPSPAERAQRTAAGAGRQ